MQHHLKFDKKSEIPYVYVLFLQSNKSEINYRYFNDSLNMFIIRTEQILNKNPIRIYQ